MRCAPLITLLLLAASPADEGWPGPRGLRISVDYRGTPLAEVCADLRTKIGVDIVCSRELADLPIDLSLTDVRWRTAVSLLGSLYELDIEIWSAPRPASRSATAVATAPLRRTRTTDRGAAARRRR